MTAKISTHSDFFFSAEHFFVFWTNRPNVCLYKQVTKLQIISTTIPNVISNQTERNNKKKTDLSLIVKSINQFFSFLSDLTSSVCLMPFSAEYLKSIQFRLSHLVQ